jgi:hypothetical protein
MLKKLFIVYAFLLSYSGAIAHSIVPHHHHVSNKEAKGHHHHGTANHSHNEDSKKDKDHEGEPYFLTHDSNTDAALNHSLIDSSTKGNKIEFKIQLSELLFSITSPNSDIFHPPSNERLSRFEFFHSRSLRGPPFFIV